MKSAFGTAMLAAVAASSQVFNIQDTLNSTTAEGVSRLDIDSSSRFFIDQDDRQVLLHGVNVVYKVTPYIPSTGDWDTEDSLDDHDIELLKQWGFNFVRLGVMWEAVEREEGVYDEEYLNKVEAMINKLGDAGIYTLVDAHQDVFSRQICGEGVPTFWAEKAIGKHPVCFNNILDPILSPLLSHFGLCTDINDMGYSYDEDGLPTIPDCQSRDFYTYYMTKESMEAFHSLLVTNAHGVQDAFVNFWDRVTERFAGNNYVVGYDPLNEPFPGNPTRDLSLTWPGKFDREYLQPLYSKIYTNAKKHDSTKHLWFEPVPFPDEMGIFGGYVFNTGFTEPPGAEIGSPYHALNDHTYCCQMNSKECLTGEPKIEDYDKCLAFHQKRLYTRDEDATALGVPFIVTEFGACLTEGPCT
jgi:endoglycosylceramidase